MSAQIAGPVRKKLSSMRQSRAKWRYVAPCELVLSSANSLRRLCASKRSRCGAVQMCLELGEPSAEIVRVEALSLWRRANLSCSRGTLCVDPAYRNALAVVPCEFRSICLLSLLAKRCLEVVSWFARLLSRSHAVSGSTCLVRGSSGLKIATFNYESSTRRAFQSSGCKIATSTRKSSTRSALPQLRHEICKFQVQKVLCEARSRSSGPKIASFKYKSSTRRAFPELQLQNYNLQVQK